MDDRNGAKQSAFCAYALVVEILALLLKARRQMVAV
jgi:hypothetical protein